MTSIIRPYKDCKIGEMSSNFNAGESWRGDNVHTGIDLVPPNPYGKPVVAVEDCVVARITTPGMLYTSKDDPEYLNKLKNGYGVFLSGNYDYLYWHLLSIIPVNEGDKVKKGKIIGFIGNSGTVFFNGQLVPLNIRNQNPHLGSHLHFEVRKKGTYEYLNPLNFIDWALPVPNDYLDFINSIKMVVLKINALLKK